MGTSTSNNISNYLEIQTFRLLHIIQRVILVIVIYLLTIPLFGIPNFNLDDLENEEKSYSTLFYEIVINTIIIVLIVFVIKKMVEQTPFIFHSLSKVYNTNKSKVPVGYAEIATISLVIFTTQMHTRSKLMSLIDIIQKIK